MPKIRFSSREGVELAGTLELPPGGDWRATALFAHCFTCSRDIRAAREITRALARQGFAVLRFDFTGLGESEGDFSHTDFSSNLDDLEDAASWLGAELAPPQLLVGHSLGGTAVLAVAPRLPTVRAIATLGAPASPSHVLGQFAARRDEIEREGSAQVEIAGRRFRIRRDFIEDVEGQDLGEQLRRLGRALLVMHAPADQVVSIDEAQKIFVAARHPKSFVSLHDADHLLSDSEQASHAGQLIAAWAARFLQLAQPGEGRGVMVRGRLADGFLAGITAGPHRLVADEPAAVGGSDQGPDPYQLLAAALGTCTVMTLNMYARRKRLAVDRVSCLVEHRKVHASDCEDCESGTGKVDELLRTITIEGALDAQARSRLLEIADRCPVHRTLKGEIRIVTRAGSGHTGHTE